MGLPRCDPPHIGTKPVIQGVADVTIEDMRGVHRPRARGRAKRSPEQALNSGCGAVEPVTAGRWG